MESSVIYVREIGKERPKVWSFSENNPSIFFLNKTFYAVFGYKTGVNSKF